MEDPARKPDSFEEFHKLKQETDDLLEFIDGVVCMSPSPSIRHQRISAKLHRKLMEATDDSGCEALAAPLDIVLSKKTFDEEHYVIPDLSVICDKTGFTETKYMGVPELIMEIISPSNASHDLVLKLGLYQKYGVKEYWIVDPLNNKVLRYRSDETYRVAEKGSIQSNVVQGFQVEVEELFRV
ncbi:Uma2 family endonuclease [Shouchella shacheensis]|uniref:Uma2 family endonuclease n=1 Tax=Shouchella shacheensis TaxID=1649580 RepID=UPI0007400CD6|nr:Uma2 family endonuclease [Shouchella shacheensis]